MLVEELMNALKDRNPKDLVDIVPTYNLIFKNAPATEVTEEPKKE